jgi:hypothetical protein
MKFLILFMLSFSAMASQWKLKSQNVGTSTATSTMILDFNYRRCFFSINNTGSHHFHIKFGSNHTAFEGVTVLAGAKWEPIYAPVDKIWIKSANDSAYDYIEGDCL